MPHTAPTSIRRDVSLPARHRFVRHGLLGTAVEVSVRTDAAQADHVARRVFGEIMRLQAVFSRFDEQSELRRYLRGEAVPSSELAEVLGLAERWRQRSRGAFDPGTGALSSVWAAAALESRVPTDPEIAAATVERSILDLGGIAKGWIVDRAARAAAEDPGVSGITVNAGGDLVHLGDEPIIVGIEDPRRPYDNVAPLRRMSLANMALATSSGSRRNWVIDNTYHSHLIDPHLGRPCRTIRSASVLADDGGSADALATILAVVDIEEGLALCDDSDAACLIIDNNGEVLCNEKWSVAEPAAVDQPHQVST